MLVKDTEKVWRGSFLLFSDEGPRGQGSVTHVYSVRSLLTRIQLAEVVYWNTWRKYVLSTQAEKIFDDKCLTEVVEFVKLLNDERKARLLAKSNK